MQDTPITGDYALPAGSILNHSYRIEQILGKGGFAIIYQATELATGNIVAIKEYFPSDLAKRVDKQDLFYVQPLPSCAREFASGHAHFLEEARILKECQELPGIVHVYDFFKEHHTAYLIMEYIDGPTLEQYVSANGVLSASELLDLFLPLLRSLKMLHEKGLIHRDISPDNLILGMDNRLTLIDFGAAKERFLASPKNHTIILKKSYAPPEQYQSSGNIGTWSDIYALCATMYFALSGHAPVPALERLQNVAFVPLSALVSISPHIASVLERGLSLNPADRYKTAEQLSYALTHPEAAEQNHTVIDLPASAKMPFFKQRHRSPKRLPAFLLLLVLLLFSGGMVLLTNHYKALQERTAKKVAVSSTTSSNTTESANRLTMGNVIGLTEQKAKEKINLLDPALQIKVENAYRKDTKKGYVCDQSIAYGTTFYAGSIASITLTVSLGQKEEKTTEHTTESLNQPEKTTKTPATTEAARQKKTTEAATKDQDFQIKTKPKSNSFEIE